MDSNPISAGVLDSEIVYYGPHPCDLCGEGLIAKSGNGHEPVYRLDYPDTPIYPNTEWREHVCHAGEFDIDKFINELTWSPAATEWEKTLVAGNLKNLNVHLKKYYAERKG